MRTFLMLLFMATSASSQSKSDVAPVKEPNWKQRAAAYLADTEGKKKHDLPLLTEWDKLVGKPDAGSRKLFAEMVKTNGDLLEVAESNRTRGIDACAALCKDVLANVLTPKGQHSAELGDIAAILFVDGRDPSSPTHPPRPMPVDLLKNPTVLESLNAKDIGPAFRKLVARWVEDQPTISPVPRIEFADLARKTPFPEAVPALIKLANDRKTRFLIQRLLAVEALGVIGGKEAASALAELVPNSNLMFAGEMWENFLEGDSALAASLIMHGKKIEDYELIFSKMTSTNITGTDGKPHTVYGFPNADARVRAIKKWKAEVVEAKDDRKGK